MRFELKANDLTTIRDSSPKLFYLITQGCIDDCFHETITRGDKKEIREATKRGEFTIEDFAYEKEILDYVSANYEPLDVFTDDEIAEEIDLNYVDEGHLKVYCATVFSVGDVFEENEIIAYAKENLEV